MFFSLNMSSDSKKPEKTLLYEISYIRPIVIFLLVVLHSFEKISAGGLMSRTCPSVPAYEWFQALIKGFRIETIALVAGYVFAYQCIDLNRSYKFWPFLKKKFKRLIIPMLFFGTVYYFCFFFRPDTFSLSSFILILLSGCGHLWFLPMLFWCFLAIWTIDHYKLSSPLLFVVLAGLSILPIPALPLGFTHLPHFLFYVYAGYVLWKKRDWVLSHLLNGKTIVYFWVVYVAFVVIMKLCFADSLADKAFVERVLLLSAQNAVAFVKSCVGTMALYLTICKHTTQAGFVPKKWVVKSSDLCYGVYVFHQFILVYLYFYTPLYDSLSIYLLPWVGLIVTFILSLILTFLFLRTKTGRLLIG